MSQGEVWLFRNPGELRQRLDNVARHIEEQNLFPACLKVGKYEDPRNLDQNALIYCLYKEISQHTGEGVVEVKRECKLRHGVPILRAHDEEFRKVYDKMVRPHDYMDKLKIMDFLPVTSRMKKPQASEYIDSVMREYSQQGVRFTDARRELQAAQNA